MVGWAQGNQARYEKKDINESTMMYDKEWYTFHRRDDLKPPKPINACNAHALYQNETQL